MIGQRHRRIFTVRRLIIFGVISLSFTFFILIFSWDLHLYNSRVAARKKISDGHGIRSGVVRMGAAAQEVPESIDTGKKLKVEATGDDETIEFHKDTRPPLSVPRIRKYCNVPHNDEMGQEGLVPKEYQLLNVHVVIRHGDRSPIARLPNGLADDMSCVMGTDQHSHIPKVTNYVHIMAEASQRRPKDKMFNRWALYPAHSVCADGQLTGRGAVQQILNGMHYSERYYHQLGLFDETNWEHKVVAHTTEVSRTFQSAIAFLYGLLPKFDIEKVNLKSSVNINFCEERVFGPACVCFGIENFRAKARRECKAGEDYQNMLKKYKTSEAHLKSVLNVKPNALANPTALLDGLSPFACHNAPPPCNARGECITAKSVEAMWGPVDYESECLHKNENFVKYAKAMMHGLLYRIAREMNVAIQNGSNPTFHLYSGHDTTVGPLITALGLQDAVWPSYASRITFELYHKKDTDEHMIRILQNGKVVTSEAVFCKDKTEDGFCSFTFFYHHVSVRNLQDFCNSIKFTSNLKT